MIFDFSEKIKQLKTSGTKSKLSNTKNIKTAPKIQIEDELDTKYNELYSIFRRNNHSAPVQKKLKYKKYKNFKKLFNKKNKNKKLKKKATGINIQVRKINIKNVTGQNKLDKNKNNIQIIVNENDDSPKIKDNTPKQILKSITQSSNSGIEDNNSTKSISNNIRNDQRKSSDFSLSSLKRNFILKSELNNTYSKENNKEIFSDGKHYNPVLEYYKDMNSQVLINLYSFTDKKTNKKNDVKSTDSFGNSNKNIISNNSGNLNRKMKKKGQIITDVFDEDEEENYFNLNTLHCGGNSEGKNEMENQIKQIIYNNMNNNSNDELNEIKKKNNLCDGNEKYFNYYLNQNFGNNRNYIAKKDYNNYVNCIYKNTFPTNFILNHNVYNIYQTTNPKSIINIVEAQPSNLNYYDSSDNQEINTQLINNNENENTSNIYIGNNINIDKCNFTPKNYNMQNSTNILNNNELNENSKTNEGINKTANIFMEYNDIQLAKIANILIRNQEGCRYLQKKIKNSPDFANNILFAEIKNNIKELSCDPFGNYFFQVLIDDLNFENINLFLDNSQKDFSYICRSRHGTRVIQKLIEKISSTPLLINKLIYNLSSKDLGQIFKSPYGNHVIQKLLECIISPEYYSFIFKYIFENFTEIARTKHGVCVIQKCVSVGDKIQRAKIFELILKDLDVVIKDQFGNYLIQYILINTKTQEQFDEILCIIKKIEAKICEYCKSKFSANTIEICFENAECIIGENILENLIKEHSDSVIEILANNYGIYVIKKALKFQSGKYKMDIFQIIQSHQNEINSDNAYYIQKLVETNKELGEMLTVCKEKGKAYFKKKEKNKKKHDNGGNSKKREYQNKNKKTSERYYNKY